jgi:hypothetical protein
MLKEPYELYLDDHKRHIVHATLKDTDLYGAIDPHKFNKNTEDPVSRIYHPALQEALRVGHTCSTCRLRCHGPCTAE